MRTSAYTALMVVTRPNIQFTQVIKTKASVTLQTKATQHTNETASAER